MPWRLLPFFLVALIVASPPAGAEKAISEPAGRVVLVIDGNVSLTNAADSARFDMAMLKRIKTNTIKTETPWTEGIQTFEGPLLSDVLKAAGATGTSIRATAINDYAVSIPVSDIDKYSVILAHTLNGKAMPVREKGPLWIVYPWADNPGIRKETYYAKSIWQVKKLTIQ